MAAPDPSGRPSPASQEPERESTVTESHVDHKTRHPPGSLPCPRMHLPRRGLGEHGTVLPWVGRRQVSRAASTHLYRFSAPVRILSSLLICWWIRALRLCRQPFCEFARRSQPCREATGHGGQASKDMAGGDVAGTGAPGRIWACPVWLWVSAAQPGAPARRWPITHHTSS